MITTGGTGPSGVDYVYEVTRSLKPQAYVRGLRMRPGRPTGIAVLSSNKVIINLSGHPISTLNAFTIIVKEVIKQMAGVKVDMPEPRVNASLVKGQLGDEEFARQYRVRVTRRGNEYLIEAVSYTHLTLPTNREV